MNRRIDNTISTSLEGLRPRFRPNSAMRFIDLVVGGFAARQLELKLDVPEDFDARDGMQIIVFASERGRWIELPCEAELEDSQLRLCIPLEELNAGPASLVHLAVALMPQGYSPLASLS
ncbi:hypothetical protein HY009_04490 [Candidatus Acetothermia bacterium]|nr:hypothetical protein [Candidatus Acetothermia bacterium]